MLHWHLTWNRMPGSLGKMLISMRAGNQCANVSRCHQMNYPHVNKVGLQLIDSRFGPIIICINA